MVQGRVGTEALTSTRIRQAQGEAIPGRMGTDKQRLPQTRDQIAANHSGLVKQEHYGSH